MLQLDTSARVFQPHFAVSDCPLPLPEELRGYGLARSLNVIRPMIEGARSKVRRGIRELERSHPHLPFDPEHIEALLAINLALPLLRIISRVMVLELNVDRLRGSLPGSTSQERFSSFLDRACEPDHAALILDEYPVLVSQVALRVSQWADFSLEFLRNLTNDWPLLRARFFPNHPGTITAVQSGAGDCHCGGRSVLRISFGKSSRLIYKPRPMALDEHFEHLLAWVNDRGFTPAFRLLNCVDRGHYGWSEFISPTACRTRTEITRFYRRQGGNLALLYALEACDFHCENVIAAGEHPVLVDLEALFHPQLHTFGGDDADALAHRALGYSVLRTGLLPLRYAADFEDAPPDISGLGSPAGKLTPSELPCWENVDTDEMRLTRQRVAIPGADNRPVWNGAEVKAEDHCEALETGFAEVYRLLLNNQHQFLCFLQCFEHDHTRVIVRRTQHYARFLQEILHPDLLRSAAENIAFSNRLSPTPIEGCDPERLLASERRDLLQQDVPLFTTRPSSRHLWDSWNTKIQDFHPLSGMEAVRNRVDSLSESDLSRQLWILRGSLQTEPAHPVGLQTKRDDKASSERELSREELILAACRIGDYLEKTALRTRDEATWIGLFGAGENGTRLDPLGFDLYDGLSGVALFLAQLAAMSGEARYDVLARAAWNTATRQMQQGEFMPIGGFNGWGGIIYACTRLSSIWHDSRLLNAAQSVLSKLPDLIDKDEHFDVIGGAAGCMLGLTALLEVRPSPLALQLACQCGERLLETARRQSGGIGWVDETFYAAPLTGFAHGNAGIAYALLKLFEHTRDERFAVAARDAIEYERGLFSAAARNWPDLRKQAAHPFMVAWCHGAPGIALARMCSLAQYDCAALRSEIDVGLGTTVREGVGGNHSLCHGDVGNIDILLEASTRLREPAWRAQAQQLAATVLDKAADRGWVCGNPPGIDSPGLMTGMAGIGYGLLRLTDPSLPSVLALA